MNLNIDLRQFAENFTDLEKLAILAQCIERGFRYNYEAIARKLNVQGRTAFTVRDSWKTRGLLLEFIFMSEVDLRTKFSGVTDTDIVNLNKKRNVLERILAAAEFERWMSEFLQVYDLTWIMSNITHVLIRTRPELTYDRINYQLNLSLEGVEIGEAA